MGSGGLNKNWKESFLTAIATVIKKDLIMSIKKHADESSQENCEDCN